MNVITPEELLRAQANDSFCLSIRSRLNGGEDLPFVDDYRGYLTRVVERHLQVVIREILRARILHMEHHVKTSAHPGGRRMYYSIRREYYWPSMAVDCYNTVRNCETCAKNRVKLRKHKKYLRLFSATEPL